jgi:hypothetical protein
VVRAEDSPLIIKRKWVLFPLYTGWMYLSNAAIAYSLKKKNIKKEVIYVTDVMLHIIVNDVCD